MDFWFLWLSRLVGVLSVFSLAQRYADFSVARLLDDLLTLYRQLFHPVAEWIWAAVSHVLSLVWIKVPAIPPDVVVVYLLLGAGLARYTKTEHALGKAKSPQGILASVVVALLWPLLFLFFMNAHRAKDALDSDRYAKLMERRDANLKGWALELVFIVAAFFVLFLLNAAGPSIGFS